MGKNITLQEMQKIELNILKYVDNICKENNIEYFLIGGSLIGAIRHNGFIPWDDDIDIALTRDNYERLKEILRKEQNERYIFMDNSVNESYFYPFMKVVDSKTTMVENEYQIIKDYGIYIDIFAYDGVPSEKRKQDKYYRKKKHLQRLIFYNSKKDITDKNIFKLCIKKILMFYAKILGTKEILHKYDSLAKKYSLNECIYAITNWPIYNRENEIQKTTDLQKIELHEFDGLSVKIPCNYDNILKTIYGNYMELPPENKRTTNHNYIVNYKE